MKAKKVRTGVAFDPDKLDRYRAIALSKFAGNMSALIEEALDHYTEGQVVFPSPDSEKCLVHLAQEFTPFIADDIAKITEGQDQRKALASILIAYAGGSVEGIDSMQLSSSYKEALKREGLK